MEACGILVHLWNSDEVTCIPPKHQYITRSHASAPIMSRLRHYKSTTKLFSCILFIFLAFNLSYCFFGTCSLSALGSPIQNPNVHWSSLSPTNRRTIHSHFWSIALYLIVYYWDFFSFFEDFALKIHYEGREVGKI